ncbi:MAG: GtrA family protein [Propionibacteriaceae bacterium]|nr:GtrA family protein [Propionibacteriaceae bacterium]
MNAIRTLLDTYGAALKQLLRFGVVGGLGVLVNMVVMVGAAKTFPLLWGSSAVPEGEGVWWSIPGTEFNVRWYHIMAAVAFLVANLFNFQLNRWWTFGSHRHAGWFREYWPFLTVGLVALAIGQVIITALMHPHSPIALPTSIFDGSSGLRSRHYWANLISIACTIPVSFVVNKFWTFRAIREPAEGAKACTSSS